MARSFLSSKVELPSRVYMIFDDKEYHGFSNETIVARFDLTLSVVMMSTFKKKTLVFLRIISFQLSVIVISTTQGR